MKFPMLSSYGYSEYSWGLGAVSPGGDFFHIDGAQLSPAYWDASIGGYGTITPSQLLPNTPHTITVDDYGVLVIVYRVP
jgi:hypothetical protein